MPDPNPVRPALRAALFLDRDGVINVDRHYLYQISEFEFMRGVVAMMQVAQSLGLVLVVVTNQSGIGRGYYTEADFAVLSDWMTAALAAQDVQISAIYHCPHAPEAGCDCRKPQPGMLLRAARELGLDCARSVMIGDKESDVEAARRAGLRACVRLADPQVASAADLVTEDFGQVGHWLRQQYLGAVDRETGS